jgi:hypothetical protein
MDFWLRFGLRFGLGFHIEFPDRFELQSSRGLSHSVWLGFVFGLDLARLRRRPLPEEAPALSGTLLQPILLGSPCWLFGELCLRGLFLLDLGGWDGILVDGGYPPRQDVARGHGFLFALLLLGLDRLGNGRLHHEGFLFDDRFLLDGGLLDRLGLSKQGAAPQGPPPTPARSRRLSCRCRRVERTIIWCRRRGLHDLRGLDDLRGGGRGFRYGDRRLRDLCYRCRWGLDDRNLDC